MSFRRVLSRYFVMPGSPHPRASVTVRQVPAVRPSLLLALAVVTSGCSELQARRHARTGNAHFQQGDYSGAVREYELADEIHPGLHVVSFNRGLACRQLMVPGAKSAEQDRVVDCALAAFQRTKELRPDDPRGEQLYVQTLFDADRYDTLVAMYEEQLKKDANDLVAINSLIAVHSRADHWADALRWSMKRADIEAKDAEAQYTVGVMIYNRLYQKGGADKSSYDPRPDPNLDPKDQPPKTPPPFTVGDIIGSDRVKMAELAVQYLNRAIALRPNYREAMVFMGLVYRQQAFAYLDKPTEWELCNKTAEEWRLKATQESPPMQHTPSAAPAAPSAGTPS
jgi:tetratricopeptide (TPR) repeat protein